MTAFRYLNVLCPTYTLLLITVIHLLFSPVSPRGLLLEERTRLGSIPPSCYNKCNQCHPCMAIQMPTLPGQKLAQASRPSEFFIQHHLFWITSTQITSLWVGNVAVMAAFTILELMFQVKNGNRFLTLFTDWFGSSI